MPSDLAIPDLTFPDVTCDDVFRLETERLWLRWPRATDAAAITAFVSLPQVARMTASIPHPYPPHEADRFILQARAENARGAALHLALTQKTGARALIGLISAVMIENAEAEIGYALTPQLWGQGLASEAAKTLTDAIFNLTEVTAIRANSRLGNGPSRRVLEKAGFAYVDTGLDLLPARGGLHSCDRFCLERADWRRRGCEGRMPPMAQQSRSAIKATAGAVKLLGDVL